MRRARYNLEEQVGGLIDHERYELRRHEPPPEVVPVAHDERSTARPRLSIRAARATADAVERDVA